MSSAVCMGLDTSNYTTSAALYQTAGSRMTQVKRLLPVKSGTVGLRQSDALFHHVRQLPELVEELREKERASVGCVAASDRPRRAEGSYMPCFLAGSGAARELAAVLGVPLHLFSHQEGHVAAALFGADRLDLLEQPFLAFHVSGGTTDALLVRPDGAHVLSCEQVAGSLDLKAGQLIDRVGALLGLAFPAGPALEQLALRASGSYHPKAVLRDGNCHLSGVENQCRDMHEKGAPDEEVALFCFAHVLTALDGMTAALLRRHGELPVVYAGGVMSNSLLRQALTDRYGGSFAPPVFSADNAAGIALLGALKEAMPCG